MFFFIYIFFLKKKETKVLLVDHDQVQDSQNMTKDQEW